ncbi:hypothetical protein COO60DRAFT_273403 [Scenedesmus sp. NREL 46B-D3]|nr:hypothetical protein COO60DRAFT_273403 [Scenedesmus sp. NREL 46B-D3]
MKPQVSNQRKQSFCTMGARGALLFARGTWLAAALTLCLWLLFAGTHHWRNNSSISASMAKPLHICKDQQSLSACTSLFSNLVFLVLAPFLLAVSSLAIVVLQPLCGRPHQAAHCGSCSRLAAHLLPPRRFWQRVLGGLTVLDLAVLCFLAAVNGSWLSGIIMANTRKMMKKTAQHGLTAPTMVMVAKMLAKSLASLIAPNLVLLFYPITRGSVVLQALRLPYPEAIRYHRWLGHIVCLLVLLHGVMYNGTWICQGTWVAEALEQGPGHNNLLGGVAFLFVIALWIACLPAIRRGAYAVFKALHHVGFYGMLVLGCCHYWRMFWWFLPGLVLYFSEGAMRLLQAGCSGDACVLHASASSDGKLCSLVLSAPEYALASNGIVWLSAPGVSWFGTWHPFDYIAVPWPASGGSAGVITGAEPQCAMLIHMKAYSGWTRKFIANVAEQGVNVRVKTQGPYADVGSYAAGHIGSGAAAAGSAPSHTAGQPDAAIIVAGGISITPAFTVLQQLAAAGSSSSRLPVLLIWAFRHAQELELLCPPLLAMAGALRLQLTTQLFYTGPTLYVGLPSLVEKLQQQQQQLPRPTPGRRRAVAADAAAPQDKAHQAVVRVMTDPPSAAGQGGSSSSSSSSSSALSDENDEDSSPRLLVSPLCPVLSLDSFCSQAGLKLLMHLAAYAGALCAIFLGYSIVLAAPFEPLPTARAGLVMAALVATCIVVPGMALLAGSQVVRSVYSRLRQGAYVNISKQRAADGPHSGSEDCGMSAAAAAAAAAAAEVVRRGGCGRLVTSSSGEVFLQLPTLQAARHGSGDAASTAAAAAAQLWRNSSDLQELTVPVTEGRPPLQQLTEGWLATLQQLPQLSPLASKDEAAALNGCASGGTGKNKSSGRLQCSVYAMGPAALVADAQVLCGEAKGLQFVQKAYQL